jgi:transaldolase
VAIANTRRAYVRYCERFAGPRWTTLRDLGAHPQRPLWASTGTKDPAYSDVLYVEQLIGPDVINTMPESTLHAFADHGRTEPTLDADAEDTRRRARAAGVDLDAITAALEREGVDAFCASYKELLAAIETRLTARSAAR